MIVSAAGTPAEMASAFRRLGFPWAPERHGSTLVELMEDGVGIA
jgi:hypothetical protein